jgi:hypothetical protein
VGKKSEPDEAAWAAAKKHEAKFKHSLGAYFVTFAVKERGLKKWIEKARLDWIASGCPAGGPEFPPLDDPPKMLAWWQAHMTREPGPSLYVLAGQSSPSVPPPASQPSTAESVPPKDTTPSPPEAPAQSSRVSIDVNTIGEVDLAAAVALQRKSVGAAWSEYDAAQRDKNTPESTMTLRAKRFDMAVERLRKLEDSLIESDKARGQLVHVDVLRTAIGPMLESIAKAFPNLLVEQLGVERARALMLVDKLFRDLRESNFLVGVAPSLTPSTAAA